jgi:hypothetical protein
MATNQARSHSKKKPAAAAPAAASITKEGRIRVRATRLGYYGDERKRVGEVFDIASGKHFSATWMERVDGKTMPKKITGKEALASQMGAAGRAAASQAASADDPLGD